MRGRLLRLVQPNRRPLIDAALRSPATKEAASAYDAWLVRWGERLIREYGRWYSLADDGTVTESVGSWRSVHRARELETLLQRALDVCAKDLGKFAAAAFRLGHIDDREMSRRVILALWRVLEPLVEFRESGFIERRADELDDPSFGRFIKAGLLRETILLGRSPDEQRAQQVAADHAAFQREAAAHPDPLGDLRDYPELLDPAARNYIDYERLEMAGARLIRDAVRRQAPKRAKRPAAAQSDRELLREFHALPTLLDKQRFYNRARSREQALLRPYLDFQQEREKRSAR